MTTHQPPTYDGPYRTVPMPPLAQRPRSRSRAGTVVLLVLALVMTCFGGVAIGAFFAQPESRPSNSAATDDGVPAAGSAATPTKAAKAPAPTIEDGTWTVGTDFPAGTYRTTENVSGSCYWAIFRSGGSSVSDIIANDLPGGGRPRVTLKKGQDFKSSRCGTWRKV